MNMRFGKNLFGRWRFGQAIKAAGGGGDTPVSSLPLAPGEFSLRVYSADGTKTAEFGSGVGDNTVGSFSFEITTSGCGKLDFTLGVLPAATVLNYGSRVDVHLFNDSNPWYSGYVIEKPVAGSTVKPYKFSGYGYVEQLKRLIVNQVYEGLDVASVAKTILQNEIEPNTGVTYASNKIVRAGYTVSKLRFDHRTAYDAIKELAEYATDYVWGVDAQRHFFFKPVQETINEQARLFVGVHFDSYEPTEVFEDIVNHGFIKGAELDENGSNFMAEITDATSIAAYGLHQAVLDVPSAVTATDATRWGITEIGKRKNPKRKAKIKNLRLEYPNADGSFNVRRISPEGKAAITTMPMLVETSGALTFARTSVAYKNNGVQVAANVPRFENNLTTGTPLGAKVEMTAKNWMPVNADKFYVPSIWSKVDASVNVNVTDYPTVIPEFGAVIAKRIQTTGGVSRSKIYLTITGLPNPHDEAFSCWMSVLSGGCGIYTNNGGDSAFKTTETWEMLSVKKAAVASTSVQCFLGRTATAGEALDIVVYIPQLELLPYVTSSIPPQVTRAAELLKFPTTGMDKNNLDIQVRAGATSTAQVGVHQMIFGAYGASFYLSRYGSTTLRLSWYDGAQQVASATISDLVAEHVFAITHDGTRFIVFVDGVEKINALGTMTQPLPASIAIGQISASNGSDPGNCNFKDLLVSRSIRQPGQVQLDNIAPDENTLIYAPLTAGLGYTGKSLETETHEYPIAKVKYSGDSTKISTDLELGEPAYAIADDFKQIYRDKKQADHLASLNNLQLKGGSL